APRGAGNRPRRTGGAGCEHGTCPGARAGADPDTGTGTRAGSGRHSAGQTRPARPGGAPRGQRGRPARHSGLLAPASELVTNRLLAAGIPRWNLRRPAARLARPNLLKIIKVSRYNR